MSVPWIAKTPKFFLQRSIRSLRASWFFHWEPPRWTEAWIGSCTQLVQKKWEWAVKLAARSQPWIDWAKEKGLLTQLGCRGSESHMCQTSACLAFGFVFVVDSCCLLFAGRIAVSNTPGKWRQNRSLFDCFQGTNTIGWLKKCSKLSHFGPTDIQNSWENSDKRRCNESITNTSDQIRSHRSRWAIFLNMCEWRRFCSELTLTLHKLKFPKHSYLQDSLRHACIVCYIYILCAGSLA